MKIAIITTVNHNVGDDFVREGIKYLLTHYFKDEKLTFESIHKHVPITVRYGFEQVRNNRVFSRVDKFLPMTFSKDRILEADIVVQSGAPVYWCHSVDGSHCADNEWFVPLMRKRFARNPRAKFINLAAGTCQRYYSDGTEFLNCEKCQNYIRELYKLSAVTTVRDTLAKDILSMLGIDAPVIPCSSIFAIDHYGLKNEGEEYVVVNYMKGGAHYTFGQNIDFTKWESSFKQFYFELKKKERVVFSCHNEKEVGEALALDPKAEIFFKKNDYLAYMKFYGKAKFGIMNRVHGAFMMASYGKPSVIIGNDSRARMADEIGLESVFVNDLDYDFLTKQYEYLKAGANDFHERFIKIKHKAYSDYMKALSTL